MRKGSAILSINGTVGRDRFQRSQVLCSLARNGLLQGSLFFWRHRIPLGPRAVCAVFAACVVILESGFVSLSSASARAEANANATPMNVMSSLLTTWSEAMHCRGTNKATLICAL